MLGRLLALALLTVAGAAYVASRRRDAVREAAQNGGSRQRSAELRRELEQGPTI